MFSTLEYHFFFATSIIFTYLDEYESKQTFMFSTVKTNFPFTPTEYIWWKSQEFFYSSQSHKLLQKKRKEKSAKLKLR